MKLCLAIKSFQKELIQNTINSINTTLKEESLKISGAIFLPEKIKKFCVLTSPHIDKDAREHLEMRISKCLIYIEINDVTKFTKILKTSIPEGVFCNFRLKI